MENRLLPTLIDGCGSDFRLMAREVDEIAMGW